MSRHVRMGYTLTEMLGVIAVLSIIFSIGSRLMMPVFKASRLSSALIEQSTKLKEIHHRLQVDFQLAQSFELVSEHEVSLLQPAQSRVNYRVDEGQLQRLVIDADGEQQVTILHKGCPIRFDRIGELLKVDIHPRLEISGQAGKAIVMAFAPASGPGEK